MCALFGFVFCGFLKKWLSFKQTGREIWMVAGRKPSEWALFKLPRASI
jgi:hypothetical protein